MLWFFEWCEQSWFGQLVGDSAWAFPVLEGIHLLGLSLLGGAILLVDLRMLGIGLTSQRTSALARAARPWLLRAIALMLATGIPLFMSEAVKCYWNMSFRVKMVALPVAFVMYHVIRKPTELYFPVSGALSKAPPETWRRYGRLFVRHSTTYR